MPLVKMPASALVAGLALHLEHLHPGVVVVQHFALRCLPDQFVPCRLDYLGHLLDDLPLGGCWQRYPQLLLQLLQPVERGAAAVLQLRDHRPGRLVILFRPDPFRFRRREHLPAAIAAQSLQRIDRSCQRRLPYDPHQHFRLLLAVNIAFPALRAAGSVM